MPPEAPTGLTANHVAGGIALAWTNNALNATSLSIQKSTTSAFTTFTTITPPSATATSYTDTTGTPGQTYYYRVYSIKQRRHPNGHRYPSNWISFNDRKLYPFKHSKRTKMITMINPHLFVTSSLK